MTSYDLSTLYTAIGTAISGALDNVIPIGITLMSVMIGIKLVKKIAFTFF